MSLRNCWFCNKRFESENSNFIIAMHKVIDTQYHILSNTVRYQSVNINIPRCEFCEKEHNRASRLSFFPTALITFGIFYYLHISGRMNYYKTPEAFYIFGTIAGIIIYAIVNHILEGVSFSDSMPFSHTYDHPHIKELLKEGWAYGETPPKRR